jgi:hypothetical protein
VWPREAHDFTPWLAANLDYLDILELGPLGIVGEEYPIEGGRSLDVLARTASGEHVAIENQFGAADHDHLTRGLAYAVDVDASYLVVIAERHALEFRKVADYLNEVADTGDGRGRIGVFLVEVHVEEVGEYYVPRLEVAARPNWRSERTGPVRDLLPDLDTFIERNPAERRDVVRQILDEFLTRPEASEQHNNVASVSLYLHDPAKGRPLNVLKLWTDGSVEVDRGYILDSPVFADVAAQEALDVTMDRIFGDYSKTPKNYYPSVGPASPEQVAAFVDFLVATFGAWTDED